MNEILRTLLAEKIPFEYDGAFHFFGEGYWGHVGRLSTKAASLTTKLSTKATLFAEAHTGAMIALHLPPKVAKKLVVKGGTSQEEMHLTLVYLGEIGELGEDVRSGLDIQLSQVSYPPISGRINGYGRFSATESSDGKDVIYAIVDAYALPQYRQLLVGLVEDLGVKLPQDHGFVPHVTLAYVDPKDESPVERIDHLPVSFSSVYLHWGDEVIEYKLENERSPAKLAEYLISGGHHFRTDGTRFVILGSSKSGFYGHKGRPGHRGGSAPRGSMAFGSFGAFGERLDKSPSSKGDPALDDLRSRLITADERLTSSLEDKKRLQIIMGEEADEAWERARELRSKSAAVSLGLVEGDDPKEMDREARRLEDRSDELWGEIPGLQGEINALIQQHRLLTTGVIESSEHVNLVSNIQDGFEFGGRSRIDDGFESFSKMVVDREAFDSSGRSITVRPLKKGEGERAYYDGSITLSKWFPGKKTVTHELGHWLEEFDPPATKAAQSFLKSRTVGETPRRLSTIVPGSKYAPHERAKPDKFTHAYTGKIYPSGFTEILSMGMELMSSNPAKFARMDPEHFDLTYHVMHNDYDNDFMRQFTGG